MAIPVPYFGYSKNGLEVTFHNYSSNSPTAYAWDFGDGNGSIEKNPVHTFGEEGFFSISLTATNADGVSEPTVLSIGVGSTVGSSLNASILELIDQYMPSALSGESSSTEKISLILRWQLYLQPLVITPNVVEEADVHNEFKWPGLVNFLIAQLCSYDVILQGANQFLSASGNLGGDQSSSSTGTSTTATDGTLKSIKTGPAEAEFYEGKTESEAAEVIANIGAAYSSATKAGGALDQLKSSICQLSKRVNIYLPMCGPLGSHHKVFDVHKAPKNTPHNANPFGVTERMV